LDVSSASLRIVQAAGTHLGLCSVTAHLASAHGYAEPAWPYLRLPQDAPSGLKPQPVLGLLIDEPGGVGVIAAIVLDERGRIAAVSGQSLAGRRFVANLG
jgi:hypothetical protein